MPAKAINGVLPLNKPAGATSAKAAKRAQKLLAADKAGHGGTLDPAACGLLLVMCGEATKFARYLLGADKVYLARFMFGYRSDTDDRDGVITPGAPPPQNLAAAIGEVLPDFCGEVLQHPPAHSAIKYNGRRLYDYARKGEAVPAKPKTVAIYNIALQSVKGNEAELTIHCGSGVYIRSLARDIGDKLGCGGYLSALERAQIGNFNIKDAITPEQLDAMPPDQRQTALLPVDVIVHNLPAATLPEKEITDLGEGRTAAAETDGEEKNWRIYSPAGKFAGIAEQRGGQWRPLKFLHWTRRL